MSASTTTTAARCTAWTYTPNGLGHAILEPPSGGKRLISFRWFDGGGHVESHLITYVAGMPVVIAVAGEA